MEPEGSVNPHKHRSHGRFRRFVVAPASIIASALYAYFFYGDIREQIHEATKTHSDPHVLVAMQNSVARQLQQIGRIDAVGLTNAFTDDLDTHNCDWLLHCTAIVYARPQLPAASPTCSPACQAYLQQQTGIPAPASQAGDNSLAQHMADAAVLSRSLSAAHVNPLSQLPPAPPPAWTHLGPIPLPTLHSLLGIPHAGFKTTTVIWSAGFWAFTLFLASAAIYLGTLAMLLKSKDGGSNFIGLRLMLTAPFIIPLLVQLIQWIATGLFKGVSWVLAELILLFVYASGLSLSLLVAVPHIYKTPHEIAEAAEIIRNA